MAIVQVVNVFDQQVAVAGYSQPLPPAVMRSCYEKLGERPSLIVLPVKPEAVKTRLQAVRN